MLRQKWFFQDSMEMVGEDCEAQLFYDCESDAFYLVEEDYNHHIVITQITEDNTGYSYCMEVKRASLEDDTVVWFSTERSKQ